MKRIMTLVLAAGLVFGAATGASAVDFKAKGQWIFGFGVADSNFVTKANGRNRVNGDTFDALQRLRLQMDAVASESLSGTVYFEIGDTTWGHNGSGGALGADSRIVEVKRAYLDWIVPNTDLKFRMGIQGVTLPNVAGGSAILDDDAAAITASYKFNDMVSLTALWARPYNDNYSNGDIVGTNAPDGYLDNVDLFALMLPISGDGWKVTPWAMYGMVGANVLPVGTSADFFANGLTTIDELRGNPANIRRSSNAYHSVFFAGLPIAITALDPWNFELDLNYGYAYSGDRYDVTNKKNRVAKRGDSIRSGWLIKGLMEYKMDWGTPGLFAWYGSGDDSSVKNGSERMPYLSPCGNFTSFMGDGSERGWSLHNGGWGQQGYDMMLNYSGTWGVGLQLKDMSFMEDLKHTFRVAYWGGTNSPTMAKYLPSTTATDWTSQGTVYLTTNDALVEFNLDSTYQIYENLTATLELGYIVNAIDKGTWEGVNKDNFSKGDAYKAALIFNYSF